MSLEQQFRVVLLATVLLGITWVVLRIRRFRRGRRRPTIHPKLQKYQEAPDVAALRRAEAEKIVATSSTGTITGYQVVRQIEAVYVDGFRRAEDAVQGLKAAAAMKGANAVINVRHAPSGTGRYSASGDAVVVAPDSAPNASHSSSGFDRPA